MGRSRDLGMTGLDEGKKQLPPRHTRSQVSSDSCVTVFSCALLDLLQLATELLCVRAMMIGESVQEHVGNGPVVWRFLRKYSFSSLSRGSLCRNSITQSRRMRKCGRQTSCILQRSPFHTKYPKLRSAALYFVVSLRSFDHVNPTDSCVLPVSTSCAWWSLQLLNLMSCGQVRFEEWVALPFSSTVATQFTTSAATQVGVGRLVYFQGSSPIFFHVWYLDLARKQADGQKAGRKRFLILVEDSNQRSLINKTLLIFLNGSSGS